MLFSEVGSSVSERLKVGDAVVAIVVPKGSHGAYREQIVLDARSVADGAVLNELVIPAVRDGGAFTSVRGFQGIPQRDIHFTTLHFSACVGPHKGRCPARLL
jgi:hypothetical protein